MFWLAVVFAAVAFVMFALRGVWPEKPRKFDLLALGLACLTLAWAAQVIFTGSGRLSIH